MIGRRFRNHFLNTRNDRRAQKAQLRAMRSNHRWMNFFRSREDRIAKWKRIFKPFMPLTLSRFSYFWAAMSSMLAGLIHTISTPGSNRALSRAGMIRWGGGKKEYRRKKSKRAKAQSAASSANTYESLEPRQLLAIDILGVDLISDSGMSSSDDITNDVSMIEVSFDNSTVIPAVGEQILLLGPAPANTVHGMVTLDAMDISNGSVTISASGLPEGMTTLRAESNTSTVNVGPEDSLEITFDSEAPTITAPADVTVELDTSDTDQLDPTAAGTGAATFDDGAGSGLDGSEGSSDVDLRSNMLGNIEREFTATDVAGNETSVVQNITVVDTIAPTAIAQNVTVSLNSGGNASVIADDVNNGSNGGTGSDIDTLTLDVSSFTGANLGANTVTLTATDFGGNSATATAVVTVNDSIAPVVSAMNFAVNLDGTGNATISAGDLQVVASDNDGFAPAIALSQTAFTAADLGAPVPVTVTATDSSGNNATTTVLVTVNDVTAPMVVAQPVTVNFDANGMATVLPGAIENGSTDNSGGPLEFSLVDFGSGGMDGDGVTFDATTANLAGETVTLYVRDASGNVGTATASVNFGGVLVELTAGGDYEVEVIGGNLVVTQDPVGAANVLSSLPVANVSELIIDGSADSDSVRIIPSATESFSVLYNGDGQAVGPGDVLIVDGQGAVNGFSSTYTPDASILGNGNVVTTNGTATATINFTGLEPVDITGMLTATVVFPSAIDDIDLDDGMDSSASTAAVVVSGTSGGVPFETAHLFGNTNVVIDTSTVDGADMVDVNSADMAAAGNTNLTIQTGSDTDVVNVNGAVVLPVDGILLIESETINTIGDISTSGSGTISLNATGNIDADGNTMSADGNVTFTANGNVDVAGNITTSGGAVILTGDNDSSGDGSVLVESSSTISSAGGNIDVSGTSNNNGRDGIEISGDLDADDANITLSGTSSGNSRGVNIQTMGSLTVIGTGAIDINGESTGTGSSAEGVRLQGDLSSVDGDITINGMSSSDDGIRFLDDSLVEATGTGNVTLEGTSTGTGGGDDGVQITGDASVMTGGLLTVNGTANNGRGIAITSNNGGTLVSIGAGDILITAISNVGGGADLLVVGNSEIGGAMNTGNITINADTIEWAAAGGGGTPEIESQGGELLIQPRSVGTTIGLGDGPNAAAGTLNLDNTELGYLVDGFSLITIGNADAGAVAIDDADFQDHLDIIGDSISVTDLTSPGNAVRLIADTADIVSGGAGTDVSAASLVLLSTTGVATSVDPLETDVDQLEADGGTGGVYVENTGDLEIGNIAGSFIAGGLGAEVGIVADNDIEISATGSMTVSEEIEGDGTNVEVQADVNIDVNALIGNSGGGDVNVLGGVDITFSATGSIDAPGAGEVNVVAGDTTTSGNINMDTMSTIDGGDGVVEVIADNDITLSSITTTADVKVEAGVQTGNTGGEIFDGLVGEGANVTASGLLIISDLGIGNSDDINTSISTLSSFNSFGGNTNITNDVDGLLTIGSVFGVTFGVQNNAGDVNITNASPVDVNAPVTANGSITITASDDDPTVDAAGDNLNVNNNINSITSNVVLNAGDDLMIAVGRTVAAPGGIFLNLDQPVDTAGNGSTLTINDAFNLFSVLGTTVTGGNDADVFNLVPQVNSSIFVNGDLPTALPGDVVNIANSAAGPLVLIPTKDGFAIQDTGAVGTAGITLENIESFNLTNDVDVIVDLSMSTNGVLTSALFNVPVGSGLADDAVADNTTVQLNGTALQITVSDGTNSTTTQLPAASVLGLQVIGSGDDDTLTINETADGLPMFAGDAPGAHTNAAFDASPLTPDNTNIGINFVGGAGGNDALAFNFLTTQNVAYFSDSVAAANSGVVNIDGVLTVSFENLAPLTFTGTGGTLLVDATSTAGTTMLDLADDGTAGDGVNVITGDGGFETTTFSGFSDVEIRGGVGAETITLSSLDSASGITTLEFDGDDTTNADTTADTFTITDGTLNELNPVGGDLAILEMAETLNVETAGTLDTDLIMNDGSTLTGDGTINGSVTFAATLTGQTIAPSNGSGFGVLDTGALNLQAGGTVEIDLGNPAAGVGSVAGTDNDQINVTGAVNLNDATLDVTLTAGPTTASYLIIQNDGADAVNGTFDGLPEGAVVPGTGGLRITYVGGTGNDVVLFSPAIIEFDSTAPPSNTMATEDDSAAMLGDGPTLVLQGDLTHLSEVQRTIQISLPATTEVTVNDVNVGFTNVVIPAANYLGGSDAASRINLIQSGDIIINDDNLVEGPEQFSVTISQFSVAIESGNADSSTGLAPGANHTIIDNDDLTLTLTGDSTVAEGSTASYTLSADGVLQGAEEFEVTLDITFPGASPAEAADFVNALLADITSATVAYDLNPLTNGSYSISGSTATSVTLKYTHDATDAVVTDLEIDLETFNDTLFENAEDFNLAISGPTSSTDASVILGTDTNQTTTITDNDVAVNDTAAATEDGPVVNIDVLVNDGNPNPPIPPNFTISSTGGSPLGAVSINTSGTHDTIDYDPSTAALQYLAVGETFDDTFTYTVSDGAGGTRTATVTVTVTGTNDTPVVTGDMIGAATETDSTITDTGTLNVVDVDNSDTVDVAVDSVAFSGGSFAGTNPLTTADVLTMLTLSPSSGLAADSPTGTDFDWTFTSGASGDTAFEFLGAGETLELTYTISATDSSGVGTSPTAPDESDTTTTTVVITITGSNDTATISGDMAGAATETDSTITDTGTLNVVDIDLTDTVDVAVDSVAFSGGSFAGTNPLTTADVLTMLTLSPSSGFPAKEPPEKATLSTATSTVSVKSMSTTFNVPVSVIVESVSVAAPAMSPEMVAVSFDPVMVMTTVVVVVSDSSGAVGEVPTPLLSVAEMV